MQRKYIPAITMLTAGAVTCIVSIANDLDKLLSLEILLGVLVVFYIIGIGARFVISKILDSGTVPEEGLEEEQAEESTEEIQEIPEEEVTSQEAKSQE